MCNRTLMQTQKSELKKLVEVNSRAVRMPSRPETAPKAGSSLKRKVFWINTHVSGARGINSQGLLPKRNLMPLNICFHFVKEVQLSV